MFEKIKSFLKIINFSGTITLKDGTQVVVDGSLEKGSKVYVQLPDAEEPIALPDGEYPLEDDSIMIIVDGVISDIKPKEEPKEEEPQVEPKQEEQMESVDISDCYPILLADKTEIYIKGDKAYDKDGNPFTDGTFESVAKVSEYKNTFTIKDGIITEQSYTSTETTVMSEEEPKNEKLVELEERLSKIEKFLTDNGVMLSKIEKIETEFNSLKEKIETVDGAKKLTTKQVTIELSPVEQKLKRIKNLKE